MEGAAARALHQGSLTFQEDSTPGMKMSRNVCRSEPPLLVNQKVCRSEPLLQAVFMTSKPPFSRIDFIEKLFIEKLVLALVDGVRLEAEIFEPSVIESAATIPWIHLELILCGEHNSA